MQNALSPAEYNLVHGVFKSLAQSDWFDRTDANERDCARMVLLVHSGGIDDADALHRACEPRARKRFARSQAVRHANIQI